ncbi:MAG: Mov34/MPN/PAD-1 family protein [Burkholderiales bacterium]|nr:Mov34/MPN/PAD-1 family protein [Burkholderiales bacterium]
MQEIAFATADGRSIILIDPVVVELLSQHKQIAPGAIEAGGVLLGHLRGPHFHIRIATSPGPNDVRSRTSFQRQDKSHERAYLRARSNDPLIAYIGDWHTHPERSPAPSTIDGREWGLIAVRVKRQCVFLIQGEAGIACCSAKPNCVTPTPLRSL